MRGAWRVYTGTRWVCPFSVNLKLRHKTNIISQYKVEEKVLLFRNVWTFCKSLAFKNIHKTSTWPTSSVCIPTTHTLVYSSRTESFVVNWIPWEEGRWEYNFCMHCNISVMHVPAACVHLIFRNRTAAPSVGHTSRPPPHLPRQTATVWGGLSGILFTTFVSLFCAFPNLTQITPFYVIPTTFFV